MNVEIFIPEISKLTTKSKVEEGVLITTVQFEARMHVGSVARILNLQRQGAPLMASIASPQAAMDLQFADMTPKDVAARDDIAELEARLQKAKHEPRAASTEEAPG